VPHDSIYVIVNFEVCICGILSF